MKRLIIAIIVFWTINLTWSQDLYMPLEIKKANNQETRTNDGSVSSSYWQNSSSYKIKVEVDPVEKLLTGSATIVYTNNSSDSLDQIVFHAYHDYYKSGARRYGRHSADTSVDNEGMVLDKVVVRGKEIDMSNKENYSYRRTNYGIKLNPKLAPEETVELQIAWHLTIVGEGFRRSGAINETSMFIAYWYPEIAVYDDIFGWDRILYDGSAEFYHDFSDFEVELTIPDNYIAWASVAPDNAKEIFSEEIWRRIQKAASSEEKITIVGKEDWGKGVKMKSNIWKYTAKQFPDFSFALSDHFIWESSSYTDKFGKYILNSAYDPKNLAFSTVIATQKEALRIFHNKFPVYEFPFHYFTIFNGYPSGGMEFAGMTSDHSNTGKMFSKLTGKEVSDFEANLGVSLHEMCHMYFPFLVGINEKRYAWMDEGMADFSSYFAPVLFSGNHDQPFLGSSTVLPVMVPTFAAPSHARINSYIIGSHSYHSLYHLLGKDKFTAAMKFYMDTWKTKHPTPYDFFNAIEVSTGMDLDWFWKVWYFDWGYMDVAISSFENDTLTLENIGGRPISMKITYILEDDSKMTEQINPIVWKDNNIYSKEVKMEKSIKEIRISIMDYSDAVAGNNIWRK